MILYGERCSCEKRIEKILSLLTIGLGHNIFPIQMFRTERKKKSETPFNAEPLQGMHFDGFLRHFCSCTSFVK